MTSNLDKTPRISAHNKPQKETHSDSTIYLFRVKIDFNVPPDQSVNPREKFATLLSVISAHFPGTALERWNSDDKTRSITTGKDLPEIKEQLEEYCPHDRKQKKLMTQWHLTSHARFYDIKNNAAVMAHLRRFNIFINLTNITAKSVSTFGWFFLSHPHFTS